MNIIPMKTLEIDGIVYLVVDGDAIHFTDQELSEEQVEQTMQNLRVGDYIVEQGRNNGWDYRKWAKGDAECWRTVSATVKTTDWKDSGMMSFLSYGLFWTRDIKIQLPYPFSFASRPVETACMTNGTVWFPLTLVSTTGKQLDKTDSYRICTYKIPEQDIEVTINFHIVGRWK